MKIATLRFTVHWALVAVLTVVAWGPATPARAAATGSAVTKALALGAPQITSQSRVVGANLGETTTVEFLVKGQSSLTWEFSTDSGGSWSALAPVTSASIVTFDDTSQGLTNTRAVFTMSEAWNYAFFRVVATNSSGSTTSPEVMVGVPALPLAPTDVTAQQLPGEAAILVSWTAPKDRVPRRYFDVSGGSYDCFALPVATSCVVQGLNYGTTYTLKLSVVNAFGSTQAAQTPSVTPVRPWQSTPSARISASSSPLTVSGAVTAEALEAPVPTTTRPILWRWQRLPGGGTDWVDVPGASGRNATVAPLSGLGLTPGSSYRLAVTYSKFTYADVTTFSNVVGPAIGFFDFAVSTKSDATSGVVRAGSAVSALVTGASVPGVDYAYQWSVDDVAVSGATGSSFTPSADAVGKKLSVAVTGSKSGYASATVSAVAALSVAEPAVLPVISQQPTDVLAMDERAAVFSVAASGTPAPAFGWEQSLDGGRSWSKVAGAQSATLEVMAGAKLNGVLFRAVVSNEAGVVRSGSARLSVSRLLRAPASFKAVPGDKQLTLSWVPSVGNKPLPVTSYIVRRIDASGTATECVVPASEPLVCVVEGLTNTRRYSFSVVAVNAAGEGRVATTAGTPYAAVVFTEQPESVTVAAGASFTLSAVVTADPVASLRWQVSSDGGRTWRNTGGAVVGTSTSLTEKALAARSGWRYRVKASQPVGGVSYSDAVMVTVVR